MIDGILVAICSLMDAGFNILFFWLPDDFIMPYIEQLNLSTSPILTGLSWLNWFAPIDIIIAILAIITPIVLIWLAVKLVRYTIQFIHDGINIFTP